MRRLPTLAIACWVACLSLAERAGAQFFDHSYAIVIGIDAYAHSTTWPTLRYAVKDAEAMTGLLRSQGFMVTPLYGPAAKKAAIISAMEDELAPKLRPGDRVLVFFAGHGKTEMLGGEKRGYIVPYDGNSGSSLISMAELKNQSSNMGNARHQLFIMDSCYGGLLAATRNSIVDTHVPHYLKEVSDRTARQVLTAGGEGQAVLDGGPKGHSVFVDALLEGLQDGLADLNGDGYITFHELVAYVTPRASNDYETPGDGVLPGHQEGEFLFRNPKGTGRAVTEIPVPASTARRGIDSVTTAEQLVSLGNARRDAGDWDGASAKYLEAIGTDPDNAEAHHNLGNTLYRNRDWDGAIDQFREATRLKHDYAEAHDDLGAALGKKEDWDDAIKEFREAVRLKPDVRVAHLNLGVALEYKEDWDEAIKEFREAIQLKPDDGVAHLSLGFALEHKGDRQAALDEYRQALKLGQADAQSYLDKTLLKQVKNSPK